MDNKDDVDSYSHFSSSVVESFDNGQSTLSPSAKICNNNFFWNRLQSNDRLYPQCGSQNISVNNVINNGMPSLCHNGYHDDPFCDQCSSRVFQSTENNVMINPMQVVNNNLMQLGHSLRSPSQEFQYVLPKLHGQSNNFLSTSPTQQSDSSFSFYSSPRQSPTYFSQDTSSWCTTSRSYNPFTVGPQCSLSISSKPSYSDVLAKSPACEQKRVENTPNFKQSNTFIKPQNQSSKKYKSKQSNANCTPKKTDFIGGEEGSFVSSSPNSLGANAENLDSKDSKCKEDYKVRQVPSRNLTPENKWTGSWVDDSFSVKRDSSNEDKRDKSSGERRSKVKLMNVKEPEDECFDLPKETFVRMGGKPCDDDEEAQDHRKEVSKPKVSYRNSNLNRCDKDAWKKNSTKKKKVNPRATAQSDVFVQVNRIGKIWGGLLLKFLFWLYNLISDVSTMSAKLGFQLSVEAMCSMKLKASSCCSKVQVLLRNVYSTVLNCFSECSKSDSFLSSLKKSNLQSNIALPSSGEEAMGRLLACKGKDPYSILGVTSDCSDDDIKKYYKRQAILVHPDKNEQPGAEEAFKILAHAFEIIGEPERRNKYDEKMLKDSFRDKYLNDLISQMQQKVEEARNTIKCTKCTKVHKRILLERKVYAARYCKQCNIHHAAREGDIWAESSYCGFLWKYLACMDGNVYNITEWAGCHSASLKHLQANTHNVMYRIVSCKKNPPPLHRQEQPEHSSEQTFEEFLNNICGGDNFAMGGNQSSSTRRKTKRKK